MLEKNYGLKVNGMYLVCLHPNNKTKKFMKIKIPVLEDEIKDLMSLKLKMVEEEYKEKLKKTIWDIVKPVKKKKKIKECCSCKTTTKKTRVYTVDPYLLGLEKYRYCNKCANIWLNNGYSTKNAYTKNLNRY